MKKETFTLLYIELSQVCNLKNRYEEDTGREMERREKKRWRNGEMKRWRGEEMKRWRGGEVER